MKSKILVLLVVLISLGLGGCLKNDKEDREKVYTVYGGSYIWSELFELPFFPGAVTRNIVFTVYHFSSRYGLVSEDDSEIILSFEFDPLGRDKDIFSEIRPDGTYPGVKEGYIYSYRGAYCKEESYQFVNGMENFVKVLTWTNGNLLWVLNGSNLFYFSDTSHSTFVSRINPFLIAESDPSGITGDGDKLYFSSLSFATEEDFEHYFEQKFNTYRDQLFFCIRNRVLFEDVILPMFGEDKIFKYLKTLSGSYYPRDVEKAGLWGRKLSIWEVSDDGVMLDYEVLDRPLSFRADIPPILGNKMDYYGGYRRIGKLVAYNGNIYPLVFFNEGFGGEFVSYFKPVTQYPQGYGCQLGLESDRLIEIDKQYLGYKDKSWEDDPFKKFGRAIVEYAVDPEKLASSPEGDLMGLDIHFIASNVIKVAFSFFSRVTNSVAAFSYYLDDPDKFEPWSRSSLIYSIEATSKIINLKPFFVGNSIYFQCELSSATNLVGGLCRYDLDSEELTHLRSDIPPADTVDFPPEGDWDDNKLYVTGDGRYALLVPIHFTKKCLADNPEDCIYCNRDISPNVWDFGSFDKIYAYNLTDTTQPPVEIDVTGYDGYLVPSPDHMQFAFSMGDKIGILDGNTLQVRVVEVR